MKDVVNKTDLKLPINANLIIEFKLEENHTEFFLVQEEDGLVLTRLENGVGIIFQSAKYIGSLKYIEALF